MNREPCPLLRTYEQGRAARRAGVTRDYLLRFAMVSSLARELRVVPNSKL